MKYEVSSNGIIQGSYADEPHHRKLCRLTKPIYAMDREGYCEKVFLGYTHVYWTWLKTPMDPGVGIPNKPLSNRFLVLVLITQSQCMLTIQILQTPLNSALSQSRHSNDTSHFLSLLISLSPYLSDALVQAAAHILLFFVCWFVELSFIICHCRLWVVRHADTGRWWTNEGWANLLMIQNEI